MKRILVNLIGLILVVSLLLCGCGIQQEDYDTAVSQLEEYSTDLQNKATDLIVSQTDLVKLQATFVILQNELDAIKEVYPPGDFSSFTELEEWLAADKTSELPESMFADQWLRKGLKVQRSAAEDGYIVSVSIEDTDTGEGTYFVYCSAIVNGDLFVWNPEDDTIVQNPSWTNLR